MNVAQGRTVSRRGIFGLDGVRAAALAALIAIVVIAAVVLAYGFAAGGPLSGDSARVPAGVTVPVELDRRENAPQR